MFSPDVAAKLIGGMLQASTAFHSLWESMREGNRDRLMTSWMEWIELGPAGGSLKIVQSIAEHPELGSSWENLSSKLRAVYSGIIEIILHNVSRD